MAVPRTLAYTATLLLSFAALAAPGPAPTSPLSTPQADAHVHADLADGAPAPAPAAFVGQLPSLVPTGTLDLPGLGPVAVAAKPVASAVTSSWENVGGAWVQAPPLQRFLLAFAGHPELSGQWYLGGDRSAALLVADATGQVPAFERQYAFAGTGWTVRESGPSPEEAAEALGAPSAPAHPGWAPSGTTGSGGDSDSLQFQAQCLADADCLGPEAKADILLEGDEDSGFVSTAAAAMTLKAAWVWSDDAWTSSALGSAADAMEDRLWKQEANIALDISTYRMSVFPGSWEFWSGTTEWDHFQKMLHGKESAGTYSEFSGLLSSIKSAGRGLFVTYFTSGSDGSTLGWGVTSCQPGTWSADADYTNDHYNCRHSAILPAAKSLYHQQSYDTGYVATHEIQHVLGMTQWTGSGAATGNNDAHIAAEGGKQWENSCVTKVKWYEPLKAVQKMCSHSHFWWTDESETYVKTFLNRIQLGDPNAGPVMDPAGGAIGLAGAAAGLVLGTALSCANLDPGSPCDLAYGIVIEAVQDCLDGSQIACRLAWNCVAGASPCDALQDCLDGNTFVCKAAFDCLAGANPCDAVEQCLAREGVCGTVLDLVDECIPDSTRTVSCSSVIALILGLPQTIIEAVCGPDGERCES